MKGHSIPGIKGFKDTTLEDGRAASSAFQMQESPLHETKLGDDTELETTEEELDKDDPFAHHDRSKKVGESGVEFAMRAWTEAAQRIKANQEAKKKTNSEKMDDVISSSTENPNEPVEGSKMDKDLKNKEVTSDTDIDYASLELPEEEFDEPSTSDVDLSIPGGSPPVTTVPKKTKTASKTASKTTKKNKEVSGPHDDATGTYYLVKGKKKYYNYN